MDAEQFRRMYGDEYPNAVNMFGMRFPLKRERRFSRSFTNEQGNHTTEVSRFADGSASITLEEFRDGWPGWSDEDRMDFCGACAWLQGQAGFPDIVRSIMATGNHTHWSAIANIVPHALPSDEAFKLLAEALSRTPCNTANITQAIAATKHPDAEALLRSHLRDLWSKDDLWSNDPFVNWTAFDATCCIAHLLQLGVSPASFEVEARALANHVCGGNRQSCGTFLREYYSWIPEPQLPPLGA